MAMTIDFRDLHYATLTETPDGKFTYGTPKRIGKTVSGKASPKAESVTFMLKADKQQQLVHLEERKLN